MTIKASTGARTAILEVGAKTAFDYSVLEFYPGAPPSTADAAIVGACIAQATTNGGAFVAGVNTNGLRFNDAANGAISKAGVWTIVPTANATAGFFVLKANAADDNTANNGAKRIIGTVGTSGADMIVGNVGFLIGTNGTVDVFNLRLPTL